MFVGVKAKVYATQPNRQVSSSLFFLSFVFCVRIGSNVFLDCNSIVSLQEFMIRHRIVDHLSKCYRSPFLGSDRPRFPLPNCLKVMESADGSSGPPDGKKAQFGSRHLTSDDDVFKHNAWYVVLRRSFLVAGFSDLS